MSRVVFASRGSCAVCRWGLERQRAVSLRRGVCLRTRGSGGSPRDGAWSLPHGLGCTGLAICSLELQKTLTVWCGVVMYDVCLEINRDGPSLRDLCVRGKPVPAPYGSYWLMDPL